ncbi:hypothetical protein BJX76DRAFT_344232 [Aspergillus varians]
MLCLPPCLIFRIKCQVSYNSSLSTAPPPLINYLLPPKPSISMHFHAYTPPSLKPVTLICKIAAQYIN